MTWDTENSVNIFGQVHLLNTRRAAVFLLQGESAYNSSVVGWGGHLPGGGVKAGVKEVLDAVRINTPEKVRTMRRTLTKYFLKGGVVNWALVHFRGCKENWTRYGLAR